MIMVLTRSRPRRLAVVATALALLIAALTTASTSAQARRAGYAANRSNPLAGQEWGVYKGGQDGVYPAYAAASGTERALLAKVALQPRARWYGSWMSASDARAKVHADVAAMRQDTQNRNVLVPMALFRQFPGHERARNIPWTLADRQAYRHWYDAVARGIGAAHALIILEPDLPVALTGWRPDIRLRLVKYAARTLAALPNTVIYIDSGASDWLKADQQAALLKAAGVAFVRGFALDGTHYTPTADNVVRGRETVAALAKLGIRGKHFVIDTSDNGRGFGWGQYYAKHPDGSFPNAETCQTKTETQCVTLGIPPTWRVADPAWHFSARITDLAMRWVDGFVWYNRPWLTNGTKPFNLQRTLQMARTTPFQ
jgi:hypothetical protein